ncbi:hypothetical protein EfmAA242_30350 [Enterococcus faecium]|nr:hypothetical protein EfmAA242_30350 [Enterococcus faecium]
MGNHFSVSCSKFIYDWCIDWKKSLKKIQKIERSLPFGRQSLFSCVNLPYSNVEYELLSQYRWTNRGDRHYMECK